MDRLAIIILGSLAIIHSSTSIGLSRNSRSRRDHNEGVSGECPMRPGVPVSFFLSLQGDWLKNFALGNELGNVTKSIELNLEKKVLECGGESGFVGISGFLIDKKADNDSGKEESSSDDRRGKSDADSKECYERKNERTLASKDDGGMEDSHEVHKKRGNREIRKALQIIEQRMNSFEKSLANIEGILYQLSAVLNDSKNLSNENKENSTNESVPPDAKSSSARAAEKVGTTASRTETIGMKFDAEYKGRQIEISNDLRTATRTNPLENSGYYGGVISKGKLKEGEVFQIRIEEVIDKWTDTGIAIGAIEFRGKEAERVKGAWSIFYKIKGTWAIKSSCHSLPGKSNVYKDTFFVKEDSYPLDTRRLPVGTLLGVSRSRNGYLHLHLNGVDKGPAIAGVPHGAHAFVDVMNYVTRISIAN